MTNSWSFLHDELYDEVLKLENENSFTVQTDMISNSPAIPWKYNEEEILKELLEYIRGTYKQHYSSDENNQTLDFIEAAHRDGESFSRANVIKYNQRYDKKGTAQLDIMKMLHYGVLLKFFNDKNAKRETYNQ